MSFQALGLQSQLIDTVTALAFKRQPPFSYRLFLKCWQVMTLWLEHKPGLGKLPHLLYRCYTV